jgi:hypothetical protein
MFMIDRRIVGRRGDHDDAAVGPLDLGGGEFMAAQGLDEVFRMSERPSVLVAHK